MAAVFTDIGEYFLTDMLMTGALATDWHIGWGTGTTTEDKADVDLENEATEARVTATAVNERATASDEGEFIGTLTTTTVKTISEAALYWAVTGTATRCFIRGTHTGVALATDDQIRYTIRLEQT